MHKGLFTNYVSNQRGREDLTNADIGRANIGGGRCTFSENSRSPALMVWEEIDQSGTQSISDECGHRTAPATPGLLNIGNSSK